MEQAKRLRELLAGPDPIVVAGAHSGLSAKLVELAGFEAIWASGFEISAARAVPDANVLTQTETLAAAREIAEATRIPVIADCDNGFGNAINVIRTVRDYEMAGIAAICIEDNVFPKRCSFYEGVRRELAGIEEHAKKVRAAKDARRTEEFAVIARTEALIAGWGLDEALARANAYADAGADMVLVHSKSKTFDELKQFAARWDRPTPLVAVPTIYKTTKVSELHANKYKVVIFANHALRASVKAMRETLATIRREGYAASVDDRIVSLSEVYELVGVPDLEKNEASYLPTGDEPVTAVILAAGFDPALGELVADKPKAMLDVKGRSILERQVATLRASGINNIAVVRGYKKERIDLPGVKYYDNDAFAESGELTSLFAAEKSLKGRVVVLYGDIIFERAMLEKVLQAQGDVTLSVDASWRDQSAPNGNGKHGHHPGDDGHRPDLVACSDAPTLAARGRFVVEDGVAHPVGSIGHDLEASTVSGEFSGILSFSSKGVEKAREIYAGARAQGEEKPFHEASSLRAAALTDLVQSMIERGNDVRGVLHWKGWMEVDTFEDYRRAWAEANAG